MAQCSKDIVIPLPVEMEDYPVGYAMDIGKLLFVFYL